MTTVPVFIVVTTFKKQQTIENAHIDDYHDCMSADCCHQGGCTSSLGVYEKKSDAIEAISRYTSPKYTQEVVEAKLTY